MNNFMNKKTLLKSLNNLKPLLVAIVLLVGLSYVSAVPWNEPDAGSTNTKASIDEGTPNQEKLGSLTIASLINSAHGPVVTFSPFGVGSSSVSATSNFYGPLNLFGVFDSSASADTPICTDKDGKVKLCSDKILFSPVSSVYYSPTLTTSQTVVFPSGGVDGAVSYSIDPAYSCTTNHNASTDWAQTDWPNGTTLSGSNSNYTVHFSDWGTYVLPIDCTNGKSYSVTIDVKGKIKPITSSNQKFLFPSSKELEIRAQGGGGDDGGTNSSGCYGNVDGLSAFAHVTGSGTWTPNAISSPSNDGADYNSGANIVHAGGGYGPTSSSSCYGKGGDYKTYGSGTSSVTVRNGGTSSGSNGGCPGSNLSCPNQDADGTGGYGQRGGGGGAYVSLRYTISSGGYLHVYNGGQVGNQGVSGSAKQAALIVEWK